MSYYQNAISIALSSLFLPKVKEGIGRHIIGMGPDWILYSQIPSFNNIFFILKRKYDTNPVVGRVIVTTHDQNNAWRR